MRRARHLCVRRVRRVAFEASRAHRRAARATRAPASLPREPYDRVRAGEDAESESTEAADGVEDEPE